MDFSEEMMDEVLKIFQVESEEIISKLNNNLLDLEKDPNNKDAILMLFRDAHTLKGASRMVGFNNVQSLAHKMEDVLGLAKENKISLNSKVVDILYKTVDFLSDLLQKSIQKGQEIYSEDIPKQIAALENITDFVDNINTKDAQTDFNAEIFVKNIDKINRLIPESLFILMQIEMKKNETLIPKLLSVIDELYSIFKTIGPYEIKKLFEDIKVKLEFISKASNNLTMEETEEIHKVLDSIINKLASCCELHNIELIDYYSVVFSKITEGEQNSTSKNKTEVEVEFIEKEAQINVSNSLHTENDLVLIQDKITALLRNESSINEIKDNLLSYEQNCIDTNVKTILKTIIKILDFAGSNEIQFDEETISVLKQSIEYCDNIIQGKSDVADKELILQRLEIIQQVLIFNEEKNDDEGFIVPGGNVKSKKVTAGKITTKNITDFSEIFNTEEIKTLRVDSSKLDTLVNQVNELTITKIKTKKHLHELTVINNELEEWQKNSIKALNYLKYYDKKYFQSSNNDNPISFFIKQLLNLFTENNKKVQDTVSDIAHLQRTIQEDDMKTAVIIDNLSDMVKNVRVLPLATIFHLFGRMVRDIANEKNKKIDLEIIGSETSTDKKIIEEIKAPLIHIIRNSIDHGIETPEKRIELGKNPTGKIILSARQVNNKVIIEIKDDGTGINLEKIKEKALQKGFLTQEELNSMTDEQITNIIFAPGFSTGEEITNISGRGIGLDVVQTKIAQLNGKVRILSEFNKGCCVQIELPTTMSILKAFLIKSSNQTFAIPMDAIKTVLRKKRDEIVSSNNGQSIIFENETIILHNIADILKLPKTVSNKDRETILIIENNGKIMALGVDKLIGDQEILHKKLSAPFYKLKNISGITTLDSGEICFIVNISDIMKTKNIIRKNISSKNTQKALTSNIFKILLVDDSITTRTLEKNILTKFGYNIETAENPVQAFEQMKTTRFDLIITDVEMPEMNGFEFLEKLKTDEMFFDIPVIMLSSIVDEENKKRAIELGAKKYIIKGQFNQDDFKETIIDILNNSNDS